MKDVNFNYYLSSKEDVVKILKSYLDAEKRQGEEIQKIKEEIEKEIDNIKDLIDKMESESERLWNERGKYIKQFDKERILKVKTNKMLTLCVLTIGVIGVFNGVYWLIFLAMIFALIKKVETSDLKKKMWEKVYSTGLDEKRSKIIDEQRKLRNQIDLLNNKKSRVKKNMPSIRKKFNIPDEIAYHEEFVYNLLINNRANSFNEALDKLELFKHRRYLEDIQHAQYLESEILNTKLQKEMRNMNDKFDHNNKLINEAKKLAREASSAALSAADAAESAKKAAESAEYNSRR